MLTLSSCSLDFVAACGCTGGKFHAYMLSDMEILSTLLPLPESTHYPTAALSQMAYGSSTAYGQFFFQARRRFWFKRGPETLLSVASSTTLMLMLRV